jgi:hypothetical protein
MNIGRNCHTGMTISPQVRISCRDDIFVPERKSRPRPSPAIVVASTESATVVVGAHQQSPAGRRLCLRKHNPLWPAGAPPDRRIIFAPRNLRGFVAATQQFGRYSKSRRAPKKSLRDDDWQPRQCPCGDAERLVANRCHPKHPIVCARKHASGTAPNVWTSRRSGGGFPVVRKSCCRRHIFGSRSAATGTASGLRPEVLHV